MQDVVKRLAEKPDGLYVAGGRCYRVATLFDVCTPRREKAAQETAKLYRNGIYVGNCKIIYEVDRDLCNVVMSAQKEQESYIGSVDSK
jgi:hypothetical protein